MFHDWTVIRNNQDSAGILKGDDEWTETKGQDMEPMVEKYNTVFLYELPQGLLPIREVDHAIEVEKLTKPPHRPLFQLSPQKRIATK